MEETKFDNKTARSFTGTWNNPTLSLREFVDKFSEHRHVRYIVAQKEVGENGTPHIQWTMNMKQPVKYGSVRKHILGVHVEICRDLDHCIEYCKKARTQIEAPIEFGERPFHRNRKTDWE